MIFSELLEKKKTGEASEEWAYVSGLCASREASLIERGFYSELLKEETAAGAYGKISKSIYVQLFPHEESLRDYDRLLRDSFRKNLHILEEVGPHNGPVDLFLKELELTEVHELLSRQGVIREAPEEIEKWLERLGGGSPWMKGCAVPREHRALFMSQPIRAVSLLVDAAYLASLRAIAGAQPALSLYVEALVQLHLLKVCARALQRGLEIEWLVAFFFRDAVGIPSVKELGAAAREHSPGRLVTLLGPPGFSYGGEDFEETFGKAADDYLTRIARGGAHQVYGVERVLSYVRALWVEHFNLRLCLSAVLTPLDRGQVIARLRNV
ncbi:MAG: hypothetical protein NTZ78_08680 [Candidatus Aureabacteria bacterium]|nr:hypothetical protein [Candidatus Auribacterota bacterium]